MKKLNTTWRIRELALAFIQRWYVILLVFLLSAGAAWGAMHLWPPQHNASLTVYIGVDIHRVMDVSSLATYAESEPFNIDDFKNWQLSQVESIARSEEVAKRALERLQQEDPYWSSITPRQFQTMQRLDWRDMGTWRLTISAAEADHASQAVQIWSTVFVNQVSGLLAEAEEVYDLDGDLRALEDRLAALETKILQIEQVAEELKSLTSNLEDMEEDQSLDPLLRWRVWGFTAASAEFTPQWSKILDEFPGKGEPVAHYLQWMAGLDSALSAQKETFQTTLEALLEREEQRRQQYIAAVKRAQGLSPSLTIELPSTNVEHNERYPGGIVAMLGGMVGVLCYMIGFVWIAETKDRGHDE